MQTKLSRNFFQPLLKRPLNLQNKSAYEPNFALFFAISTLIFCSLRLLFFDFSFIFFVGGLSHKDTC